MPKIGRARPLAERSIGTPDPGAVSMGMIVTAIGKVFEDAATDHQREGEMIMAGKISLLMGSDSAGFDYKEAILADMAIDDRVEIVENLGVMADALDASSYPSVAIAAAEKIAAGEADRAILICGTGIGVSIAANKVAGIRATVAHDSYSVERSILSNDCQILTMGQRVIGLQLARGSPPSGWVTPSTRPVTRTATSEIVDYEDSLTD